MSVACLECAQTLSTHQKESHSRECKGGSCPFSGCENVITGQLTKHFDANLSSHLMLCVQQVARTHKLILSLYERNQQLEKSFNEMVHRVAKLEGKSVKSVLRATATEFSPQNGEQDIKPAKIAVVSHTASTGVPTPSTTATTPTEERHDSEDEGDEKEERSEQQETLPPPKSQIAQEIGRAVQQECRDRSRMPSSA
eukprot:TRINITY_DN36809_c0_g1_i10.p1 TRINITY_DN36809_c0_g1~~TRINITY_DN36809_c0_g1_i10.p1  ORF type:complete len:197 (+),score=27.34 TRINITY_DN36809_c0_g1_i10:102-692(+)